MIVARISAVSIFPQNLQYLAPPGGVLHQKLRHAVSSIDLHNHISHGRRIVGIMADVLELHERDRELLSIAYSLHDLRKMYNTSSWNIIISDKLYS